MRRQLEWFGLVANAGFREILGFKNGNIPRNTVRNQGISKLFMR